MRSKEVFELADRLMDYDNCHDGDIDQAAVLLREYASALAAEEAWAICMANKIKNSSEIDLNKDQ